VLLSERQGHDTDQIAGTHVQDADDVADHGGAPRASCPVIHDNANPEDTRPSAN
jgi:hypothetical protein